MIQFPPGGPASPLFCVLWSPELPYKKSNCPAGYGFWLHSVCICQNSVKILNFIVGKVDLKIKTYAYMLNICMLKCLGDSIPKSVIYFEIHPKNSKINGIE